MRYAIALCIGAPVGAIVTIMFGMSVPAVVVGAFIGACVGWIIYDPLEIIREAPGAWQRAGAVVQQRWPGIKTWFGEAAALLVAAGRNLIRPRLLVWSLLPFIYPIGRKANAALVEIHLPTIIIGLMVTIMMVTMLCMVGGWLFTLTSWGHDKRWTALGRLGMKQKRIEKLLNHALIGNSLTLRGVTHQLRDVGLLFLTVIAIAIDLVITAALLVLSLLVVAVIAVVMFGIWAFKLFVAVHSEKRRMVFVDAGVGVILSYAVLRWHFGARFLEATPLMQLTFVGLSAVIAVLGGVLSSRVITKFGLQTNPT